MQTQTKSYDENNDPTGYPTYIYQARFILDIAYRRRNVRNFSKSPKELSCARAVNIRGLEAIDLEDIFTTGLPLTIQICV